MKSIAVLACCSNTLAELGSWTLTMNLDEKIQAATKLLVSRNWVTFQELTSISGLSRDELIAVKPQLEKLIQADSPGATLTSRVDIKPEGFEIQD